MPTEIRIDTKKAERYLTDVARQQLPFAISTALNATTKIAATEANRAMPSVFAHTNAFTRRAVGTPLLATKGSLIAQIGILPVQAKYLRLEIEGGTRTPASNTGMTAASALLVPGGGHGLAAGMLGRISQQAAADHARRQPWPPARVAVGS